VVIDKTINLIGEDKNTTIIDGSGSGYIDVVSLRASGINIKGFTMKSAGHHTLYIVKNDNIVTDNIISHASLCGIYIVSDNNIIYRNTVKNNYFAGINIIDGGERNQILENHIKYNGRGIFIYGTSDFNVIIGNTITNNSYGILLDGGFIDGADYHKIYHNRFIDNHRNALENIACLGNKFDNGIFLGGNYWDDYKEKYPNAIPRPKIPWIWNTPYEIYGDDGEVTNLDRYPLVFKSLKSMSHPKIINSLFLRFLEQFPILQKILLLQR
jgi:parallel beta-helix repeat protein